MPPPLSPPKKQRFIQGSKVAAVLHPAPLPPMKKETVFWLALRSSPYSSKGRRAILTPLPSFKDMDTTGDLHISSALVNFYNLLPERSPLVTVEGIFVYYLNSCPFSDYLFYSKFFCWTLSLQKYWVFSWEINSQSSETKIKTPKTRTIKTFIQLFPGHCG